MSVVRNRGLVMWIFALPLCASAATQQKMLWQGVVKPEAINVYQSASTNERVTATLRQGDAVDVVLQVFVSGSEWCRVSRAGASEPVGFVLCLNLERGGSVSGHIANTQQVASQSHKQMSATSVPQKLTDSPAVNPAVLSNKDILDMNKAGLPAEILVAKIKSSQCNFETSPASLQSLKTAGVGDNVILAMVEAPVGQPKPSGVTGPPDEAVASKTPSPTTVPSDGKTRVLVTDSQSWETRGGSSAGGNRNGWGASSWIAGGARPQTAEIIKTLNERCPQITVTNNLQKADFVLTLDHEGGKSLLARRNKVAVFNRDGDDIFSASTRELGNSVKEACQAMLNAKK
jgi:hypothetical protein